MNKGGNKGQYFRHIVRDILSKKETAEQRCGWSKGACKDVAIRRFWTEQNPKLEIKLIYSGTASVAEQKGKGKKRWGKSSERSVGVRSYGTIEIKVSSSQDMQDHGGVTTPKSQWPKTPENFFFLLTPRLSQLVWRLCSMSASSWEAGGQRSPSQELPVIVAGEKISKVSPVSNECPS